MSELPEGYKEGVPRVSSVVEFVFPFDGNSKERFHQWLADKDILRDEYMAEACDVGTFIHLQMEKYIKNEELDGANPLFELHSDEISHGVKYLDSDVIKIMGGENRVKSFYLSTEVIIRDEEDRYQGTCDLVAIDEENKKVWLWDYKTWGIAKKRYSLPNIYRKPYDKIKKLRLQFSLYAETWRKKGYEVCGMYGVWLHETGAYDYPLEMYTTEELDAILNAFAVKDELKEENINITIEDMKLIIQSPTGMQYELARVEHDLKKGEDGKKIIKQMVDAKEGIIQELVSRR